MVIVGVVGVDKKNSLIVLVRFCRHVDSILISFSSYLRVFLYTYNIQMHETQSSHKRSSRTW